MQKWAEQQQPKILLWGNRASTGRNRHEFERQGGKCFPGSGTSQWGGRNPCIFREHERRLWAWRTKSERRYCEGWGWKGKQELDHAGPCRELLWSECLCPPNPYVKTLMLSMMSLWSKAFERYLGHEGGALMNGVIKETPPSPCLELTP